MKKTVLACLLLNLFNVLCFSVLAIFFGKWWIILFALLFLCFPASRLKGQHFIYCDNCGRYSESGVTLEEARMRAKNHGWVSLKNNKDYCPDCLAELNRNSKGV